MFRRAFVLLNAIAAVSRGAAIEAGSENATEHLSAMLDAQGNLKQPGIIPSIGDPLFFSRISETALEGPFGFMELSKAFQEEAKGLSKLPVSEQLDKMTELSERAKKEALKRGTNKKLFIAYSEGIESIVERCDAILSKPGLSVTEQKTLCSILQTAGEYYYSRGMRLSAEITLNKSLKLQETLFGKDSVEVAVCSRWLAKAHRELGHTDEEIEFLTRALAITESKQANSLEHARILFRLAIAEYDKFGKTSRRNKPLLRAAKMLMALPRSPEAASLGFEVVRALIQANELDLASKFYLAVSHSMLIKHKINHEDINAEYAFYIEGASFKEKEKHKAQLEGILVDIEKQFGPQHYRTLLVIDALVDASKLPEEKIYWHERGLKIRQKAFGKDHISIATTLSKMCAYSQNSSEMQKWASEALRIFNLNKVPLHAESANAYSILGFSQLDSNPNQALINLEKAIDVNESGANDPVFYVENLKKIVTIYYKLGQIDKGLKAIQKAAKYAEENLGKDHPSTQHAFQGLYALTLGEKAKAHAKNATRKVEPM
ncbi:MAG: hypothetical protein K0R66_1068 [Gammaproteobacteria bacterium]|nr:hypothetical protein [Gammaproteobacteria bacterium]